MILKTTIAAKVTRSGLEQVSRVLSAHLFQYLESDISNARDRDMIREIVANAPLCKITSIGKEI